MLKSKAVEILKTLTPEEFTRFENFLDSPFFNSKKSFLKLLSELKRFYPEFDSPEMTEENIYAKVFGKDKFSYSSMKNFMSEMLELCDRFLLHNSFDNTLGKNEYNSIGLLEEYRERDLDKLFNIRLKTYEKNLKNHRIHNIEYFTNSYHLEILKYQSHLEKHRHNELIWKGFMKRATFELCSIFNLLYTTTDMLIQSRELLRGDPNTSIMLKFVENLDIEKFLKCFTPDESEEYFYIYIYSKLILLTINENKKISERYYKEIKKSLVKNIHRFTNEDLYDILKSLRSYAITRMQTGNTNFIDELFEIDKLLTEKIEYNSFRLNWFISEIFTEMVNLSVHMKEYEFAENFINKFKDRLSPEVKDFESGWTRALLDIEYGKYEEALVQLSGIKPVNAIMKISTRNLYLRLYYELGYLEEGFFILDAYRNFVKKDGNISESRKKYYLKLHSIFNRLYKYRTNPYSFREFEIKELKSDINGFYFLGGRDWFLKKADDLKKKIGKQN